MNATQAQVGKLYRVTKVPAGEYLTEGAIYKCTSQGQGATGLHRPNGGAGTYVMRGWQTRVELEAV